MSRHDGEIDWQEIPEDPDPNQDLGYEMEELTVIESSADSQLIFLPEHDSQFRSEEFIVVSEQSLRSLDP
ncbi:hypothetical protein ACFQL1_22480 [Halomicroarcula sp. GCM10025709]|uniref:hypothetical protein n=1 Tax=Haloarcula TaxID=2237 RepID=UPI0024C4220E|nr:hypothetical protein [Halomicroarcula sp. YJ-61-S]